MNVKEIKWRKNQKENNLEYTELKKNGKLEEKK